MYAVVNIKGKQHQIAEGRYLDVDRVAFAPDETYELDQIMLVVDGENSLVGAPYIEGAKVRVKVLRHFRDRKIIVYKMRCKKGYRRKNGHRQELTRIQIESITLPGSKSKSAESKKASA